MPDLRASGQAGPPPGPPPGAPEGRGWRGGPQSLIEPLFHRPRNEPHFPYVPMIIALLASLVTAWLLAWYFAKPIRSLRAAFDDAAAGRLDTRAGPAMGRRRDELADLGKDFDRMATQLQALVEGQKRLLHDVSHELRSPLARLHAAIGLMRQRPEKAEAMIERIERESGRMDKLIGGLLTLSRLESNGDSMLKESLVLGDLAADVVEDASFEARANGKEVRLHLGCQALIKGRAELLNSAIENVVRNAVRHTAGGTSVEVVVEQSGRETARVLVRDRGPGVPDADLENIFKPFVRSSTDTSVAGHGLGLAIAQRIVLAHGGTIRAFNAPDGGLNVELRFPAVVRAI
ncbi:HAMP domain-containing protein [Noviherbaspirillum sp. 17J57-3]|uniref:histidine kinase n=2 Tax=Noviherbaspirillum galbum TaxID=2709383 RepID=A0A6B3SFA4_9BURK|nr:HAMP domain-containing protein [Noviherbaspirillum galbum]